MLFVLNGWHDLTKDVFHVLPVSFSSSKSTVFINTVMHITEGKTMKGFGSGYHLLEALCNTKLGSPRQSKEWHLHFLWVGGKFVIDSEPEFNLRDRDLDLWG